MNSHVTKTVECGPAMSVTDSLPRGDSEGELCNMALLETHVEDPSVVVDPSGMWEPAECSGTGVTGTRGSGSPVASVVKTDFWSKVAVMASTHDTGVVSCSGSKNV